LQLQHPIAYSCVRQLDLGVPVVISTTDFAKIIATFPNLMHLRATVALVDFGHPTTLSLILQPLKTSLQALVIHNGHLCGSFSWIPLSSSDFSTFPNLKKLSVPSSTWIHDWDGGEPELLPCGFTWRLEDWKGLYTKLSPAIEDLEINFAWPTTIFARGYSYQEHYMRLPDVVRAKGFA
jgi:hypothetical protein